MKRALNLAMALVLALGLCACGKNGDVTATDAVEEVTESLVVTTGEEAVEAVEVPEEKAEEKAEKVKEETKKETEEEVINDKEFSLGTTEGNVYENAFVGLGFEKEEGWAFLEKSKIREMNNCPAEKTDEEYLALMKDAVIVYDMSLTDATGINSVTVSLKKMDEETLKSFDIIKDYENTIEMAETSMKDKGYANTECKIEKVEIDGKEVSVMSMQAEMSGLMLYQTTYTKKCNGYVANATVVTYFEDGRKALLDNFFWID